MLNFLRQKVGQAANRRRNARGACRPGRDKLSEGKFQRRHSRRKRGRGAAKGFNFVSANGYLGALIRSLENLKAPLVKGFNFVSAKSLLGRAESRFGKPRISLQGRTDLFFSLVRKEPKVPQRFANLWTPGTIQISARYVISAEMTSHHHVTGGTGKRNLPGYRR